MKLYFYDKLISAFKSNTPIKELPLLFEGSQIGVVKSVDTDTGEIVGIIFDSEKGRIEKLINPKTIVSMGITYKTKGDENARFEKD